jgi:hypothetical protein
VVPDVRQGGIVATKRRKAKRRPPAKKRAAPSSLEDRFVKLCAAHPHWPSYEREKKGLIPGRRFRADFYFKDLNLVVEIDGVGRDGGRPSAHTTATGVSYDRERDACFGLAGYRVLRFTTHHFKKDGEYIVNTMEAALIAWGDQ